jgi:ABC-2 type transport system permease protein
VETRNWAPLTPTTLQFFAPAVFALVLQHVAVTLSALSMVRERSAGRIELFRVAPVNATEILVGKYLAYGLLSFVVAGTIGLLMVAVLGVPLLGGWEPFAVIAAALAFAALGLGLLISALADSERQAVQLAMLALLASVFFSGFVLPVDAFREPIHALTYALPLTHANALLQDAMWRGAIRDSGHLWFLIAIGAALFIYAALAVRRSMRLRV